MDPFTALGVACNVIDMVTTAIGCGLAVKHIYESVDGRTKVQAVLKSEADRMKDVAAQLREGKSKIKLFTDDKEIQKNVARCAEAAENLHTVLEDCRAKSKTVGGAIKSLFKSGVNGGKIDDLQKELMACKDDLSLSIAIATRADIGKVLQVLDVVEMKSTQIATSLKEMNDRLSPSSLAKLGGHEQSKTLQGALEMAIDGMILNALHSNDLGQRFQEVKTAEEGTFNWIFTDLETLQKKEDQLSISFHDWLKSGLGIFHIAGKPGSGKSTLMKYLCRHDDTNKLLEYWKGDDRLVFTKFFFKRLGSRAQNSLHGLIQGILCEVLCELPALAKTLFPLSWELASKIIQSQQEIQLSTAELIGALGKLVHLSTESKHADQLKKLRLCFFIDGLDEFDDRGANETHGQLAKMLLDWTKNSNGSVKMCVSSRIEVPFVQNFPAEQRITLNKFTAEDIQLFAEVRLEKNSRFISLREKHGDECEQLLKQIRTDAEGVFLWVALLIHSLTRGLEKGDSVVLLQKRVTDTPNELNDFLDQILGGIEIVYRDGAFLLLATALRAAGVLLTDRERPPEHRRYDESPLPGDEVRIREDFRLSLLSSFSILWAFDNRIEMTHKLELSTLTFLDENSRSYVNKEQWSTTLLAQCNGLLEISGDNFVNFMHRSIPEFLQQYFRRNSNIHRLNDQKVSIALSWAYLVDTMCITRTGRVIESSPNNNRDSYNFRDKEFDNDRLFVFLCRLRQMELDEEQSQPLFPMLFSIENIMRQNPGIWPKQFNYLVRREDARDQDWSLLYLSAYIGLCEFFDWVFHNTRILQNSEDAFNITSSVIWFCQFDGVNAFSVKLLEKLFDNGVKSDIVFPMFTLKPHHETYFRPDIKGAPLWHAFILLALPPTKYEAQIIELWLEKGANAELLFWLETERRYARDENDGIVSIDSVKDNRDGSGRVSVRSVSRRMVSIGRKWPQPPFTLRQAIAFSNSSRKHHILDLIDAQIRERCSLAETSAEACTGLERFPDSTEVCQKTQSTNECDTRTENSQSENTAIGISNEVQHSQVDVAGKLQKRGTNLVWLSICFVFASTFGLLLARYLL